MLKQKLIKLERGLTPNSVAVQLIGHDREIINRAQRGRDLYREELHLKACLLDLKDDPEKRTPQQMRERLEEITATLGEKPTPPAGLDPIKEAQRLWLM